MPRLLPLRGSLALVPSLCVRSLVAAALYVLHAWHAHFAPKNKHFAIWQPARI